MQAVDQVNLEQAKKYLNELDLSYIVTTMCAEAYPLPCWSQSDATACAILYKEFLFLIKKHWPLQLVPTREIDEFWHNHILFTKKYHADCLNIFGHYLYHEPARPDENQEKLAHDYLRTKELYHNEFQRPLKLINI